MELMATRRELIFEHETAIDGGPLDLLQVPPIFYELRLTYAREAARIFRETQAAPGPGGPIKWIFPAFVQNLNTNSVTFCVEQEHYIGLYAGAFLVPHDAFSTLLSHPDILPDIGGSSKEKFNGQLPWPGFAIDLGHNSDLSAVIESKLFSFVPHDPFRKQYASTLARLAFDFLFYHEVSHIIAGHFDLLESQEIRARLYEHRRFHAQHASLSFDYWDALEYDADRIAAEFMLRFLSLGVNLRDESERARGQQEDIFRALAFAVGTLFRLIAEDLPELGDYTLESHPHPEVRFLQTFVALELAAKSISEDLGLLVRAAYIKALMDLWDAWGVLGLRDLTVSFDKELLDDLSSDIINRLDDLEPVLSRLGHHRAVRRWSRSLGRYV